MARRRLWDGLRWVSGLGVHQLDRIDLATALTFMRSFLT